MQEGNSKRIMTNTLILYVRMIFMTIISLYTSRVVLQTLGLEDFGIYNVVAGIVEFATVFTGTMTSATQRFLSFDLGKNDIISFNRTFCSMYNIFAISCLLIFIVLCAVGSWMVYDFLVIPQEKKFSALWVLVCSVATFNLSAILIPYVSAIIAYEQMGTFAIISIAESLIKLFAAVILITWDDNRLIWYAVILLIGRLLLNIAVITYCRIRVAGCRYRIIWDSTCLKELSQFSGWSLLGATSSTLMTQGHSMLLNIFFGPLVNAAKGIADRVKNFSLLLAQNVFLAITPQITKSYASGKIEYSRKLILSSSRLSFMLIFLICSPIVIETRPLLSLWLDGKNITDEAVSFSVNSIIFVLLTTLEAPLTKIVQATGNVKSYEIIVGIITLTFIPISYIALKNDYSANMTFIIMNVVYALVLVYRIYRASLISHFSYMQYVRNVFTPILLSLLVFCVTVYLLKQTSIQYFFWIIRFIIWALLAFVTVWGFGITQAERKMLLGILKSRIS